MVCPWPQPPVSLCPALGDVVLHSSHLHLLNQGAAWLVRSRVFTGIWLGPPMCGGRRGEKKAGENNLRGNLIALCSCLKGGCGQLGLSIFSQATSTRIRGNGLKLSQDGLDWLLGKHFSLKRVIKHWDRLLKGTVESPSLEADRAFNDISAEGWTR